MIWVLVYVIAVAALAFALGYRLRQVREAQERKATLQRRHLGL